MDISLNVIPPPFPLISSTSPKTLLLIKLPLKILLLVVLWKNIPPSHDLATFKTNLRQNLLSLAL